MFDCYGYTDSDNNRMRWETSRSLCNSYMYHTYYEDLAVSDYGCSTCHCCKSKGCYSGLSHLYDRTWSTTASGLRCQRWDEQYPHAHNRHLGTYPPGETASQAQNYCRDPAGLGYVWCYTVDPNTRWEVCGIPACA